MGEHSRRGTAQGRVVGTNRFPTEVERALFPSVLCVLYTELSRSLTCCGIGGGQTHELSIYGNELMGVKGLRAVNIGRVIYLQAYSIENVGARADDRAGRRHLEDIEDNLNCGPVCDAID